MSELDLEAVKARRAMTWQEKALALKCPSCGSNPGDRCYGGGPMPLDMTHWERKQAFSRILEDDAESLIAEVERLRTQIERVRGTHKPVEIEPSETICGQCSNLLPNGRYLPIVEYPCPTIKALEEDND